MVDPNPTSPRGRPRPILAAIRTGVWVPVLGALITAGVTLGVLTTDQGTAIQAVGVALAGVLTATTAALTALGILTTAEPLVTPVADPQDDEGRTLVPAPPSLR